MSDLLGAPARGASVDDLVRLNSLARERGYRNVASDDEIAQLASGSRAMGQAFRGDGDVVAVTWMVVPPDVRSRPFVHLLVDVVAADLDALPEWEEPPRKPPDDHEDDEPTATWVLAAGLLAAAAVVFLVVRWIDRDFVVTAGLALAGLGGALLALAVAVKAIDSRRTDYWDAMDEFFGQLELWFAQAAGAGLLVVGGLVALAGALV